jgi:hypothetical protein
MQRQPLAKQRAARVEASAASSSRPPPPSLSSSSSSSSSSSAAGRLAAGGSSDTDDGAAPAFVDCNGLRYAVPYEALVVTFLKDRFAGRPLDDVLGQMFRRYRGRQPLEEAAAHWRGEIEGGRVEIRGPKLSRDDPWEWRQPESASVEVVRGAAIRVRQHVHEKVVPQITVRALYESETVLCIDKPAGVATVDEIGDGVNSLMTVVHAAMSLPKRPQPAHRLDKPVSGVLVVRAAMHAPKTNKKQKRRPRSTCQQR